MSVTARTIPDRPWMVCAESEWAAVNLPIGSVLGYGQYKGLGDAVARHDPDTGVFRTL